MSDCSDCRCNDFEKCLKILNLMLDNEATEAEQAFFNAHVEKCMICFAHYNIERQLRQLIKTKVDHEPIPQKLADEIRLKIIG